MELRALQKALPEMVARGASLVAISPQTPFNIRRSLRHNKMELSILTDSKGRLAETFGIRFALPDYLVEPTRDSATTCRRSTTTPRRRCRHATSPARTASSPMPRSIRMTRGVEMHRNYCRRSTASAPAPLPDHGYLCGQATTRTTGA
jgi:hypothetical protein